MPWLELTLTLRADQQPGAEAALETLGALSITLQDAEAETADEAAIFEPGVGELPLWRQIVLSALFEAEADRRRLSFLLHQALPWLAADAIGYREIADQDWSRLWMDQFQPMRFGRRLWIYPWNIEPPADTGQVTVRLDPGLAFGSGTHPTTALCLAWLDAQALAGQRVLDFGCGSGVLAIAALKLGAARALGIDNDPQALTASRDNAERNGVADRLQLILAESGPPPAAALPPIGVLIANILAGPLTALAPAFAAYTQAGAMLAISGLLETQQEELLAAYAPNFEALQVVTQDGWVRIDGRRKGHRGVCRGRNKIHPRQDITIRDQGR